VSLDWFNMLYQVLLGRRKARASARSSRSMAWPMPSAMIDGALAGRLSFLLPCGRSGASAR
jgi:hypothetical protein